MFTAGGDRELEGSIATDDEEELLCICCAKFYGEESIKYRSHWVSHVIYAVYGHVCIVCLTILIYPSNIVALNVSSAYTGSFFVTTYYQ